MIDSGIMTEAQYRELDHPYLLISILRDCAGKGQPPPLWLIDELEKQVPNEDKVPSRGKATLGGALATLAADTVRWKAVLDAKLAGVSHLECFQSAADELNSKPEYNWAHGSEATMRRSYYKRQNALPALMKEFNDKGV